MQADDPARARALARALVQPLRERGARVTLDGEPVGGGGDVGVSVQTGARKLPGATVVVGLWDPEGTPRWLAPLPVSDAVDAARAQVTRFLERWGFLPTAAAARRLPAS